MAILSVAYRFGYLGVHFARNARPPLYFGASFEILAKPPGREGWGGWTFEGKILNSRLQGLVLARFPRNFPLADLSPGDIVWVKGQLKTPEPARNPGDFDVRSFFSVNGISYELNAYALHWVSHPINARWTVLSWAASFRKSLQKAFNSRLNGVDARLLSGMVLGIKGRLPKILNRQIQDAGVMHLLVPSGTKVALVLAGVWFLGRLAALRPFPRLFIAALGGGFYAAAVGGDPPYTRALFAALFFEWGLRSGKDAVPFQALTLAAWVELLWNPLSLFSMGFQMSYAAAFALIIGFSHWERGEKARGKSWLGRVSQILGATLIVEIALWPIFAVGFGRAPFLGALANLILFPLAGAFMLGGIFLWLSVLMRIELLSCLLTWALKGELSFFCGVCRFFSGLPFSFVYLSRWNEVSILVYYLFVLAVLIAPKWKVSASLASLALMIFVFHKFIVKVSQPLLEVSYFSLDDGQAALICEKGHEPSLVLSSRKTGAILRILHSKGIRKIKTLFLLSPASLAGAENLATHLKIASISRESADFKISRGVWRFYFQPPMIQEGGRKFDIINSLRRRAVRAKIYNRGIKINATF